MDRGTWLQSMGLQELDMTQQLNHHCHIDRGIFFFFFATSATWEAQKVLVS